MWSPRRRLPPSKLDVCHPNALFNSKVDEGAATRRLLLRADFQEGSRRRLGLQRTRHIADTTTHFAVLWRRQHHEPAYDQNIPQSYKYDPAMYTSAFTFAPVGNRCPPTTCYGETVSRIVTGH